MTQTCEKMLTENRQEFKNSENTKTRIITHVNLYGTASPHDKRKYSRGTNKRRQLIKCIVN